MVQLIVEYWPAWLFVTVALMAYVLARLTNAEQPLPFEKRTSLLTEGELKFYRVLQQAVDGRWSIQAMVRLADLIRVKPETPKFQAWQNRIHAKHIDFLLCDPATLEARMAVELDDRSHQRPDRMERDKFVNKALANAGLPLLRVETQPDYDTVEVRRSIDAALGLPAAKGKHA